MNISSDSELNKCMFSGKKRAINGRIQPIRHKLCAVYSYNKERNTRNEHKKSRNAVSFKSETPVQPMQVVQWGHHFESLDAI